MKLKIVRDLKYLLELLIDYGCLREKVWSDSQIAFQ